jgi:hypothetical protein
LRALEVGSRAAELSGEEKTADLLRQADLVDWLRSELGQIPEETRAQPVISSLDTTLAAVAESMDVPADETFGEQRVLAIKDVTAKFTAEIAAKQP